MKKLYSLLLISFIIIGGLEANALKNYSEFETIKLKESIILSEPIIYENGEFLSVYLEQATSSILEVDSPVLPVVTKIFNLPFGSKINRINVDFSNEKQIKLSKLITPYCLPNEISLDTINKDEYMEVNSVYSSQKLYPYDGYKISTAMGLKNDEHVLYLIIQCYPNRYSPENNILVFNEKIDITVLYKKPKQSVIFPDIYDLVIIAPEEYKEAIQPLEYHKENHSIKTLLITTEDIYSDYIGRDEPEKIKYFIKESVENFGANYILLIGSIYKLPIRNTSIKLWGRWQENTITDLYYSDLLDNNGSFSSWDSNDNNIFGETDKDQLDLYPDVHIGRLACDSIKEVEIVVDKIIHYEDGESAEDWFNDMIFIGGNTFQINPGNEGEELNEMILDIMSDFNPSYIIWTSKGNFNRNTISDAISEGAGFLDYSGHGFEHGMGTYTPNGIFFKTYLTPYIDDLMNEYELPIIFFDACLTSKLDFVLQDLLDYKQYRIFDIFARLINYDTSLKLPCFAWCFIKHEGGGAIATIGATRTAFGGVDSGAGKLSIEFFNNYKNSETVGQMMTKAQNDYIKDVPGDQFTVEEFILLGDPSLKIGGYP